MPKYTTKTCEYCQKTFSTRATPSSFKKRKYCSTACRNKAHPNVKNNKLSLECVDVQSTIERFGYSPETLTSGARKKVVAICQQCGNSRILPANALRSICRNCTNANISRERHANTPKEFHLVPAHIDIQATIKKFGYDPCFLTRGSQKLIVAHCYICNKVRIVKMQSAMKYPACIGCSYNDPMSTANRSNAQIEWNKKRGKWRMSEETKAKLSKANTLRIARDGISHIRGVWYLKADGKKIYLRSSYELGLAEFLDASAISWEYEPKVFMVTYALDGIQKESSYRPDFYLSDFDYYIEVKGYWFRGAKEKFDAFKLQYAKIDIEVWYAEMLKSIGAIP